MNKTKIAIVVIGLIALIALVTGLTKTKTVVIQEELGGTTSATWTAANLVSNGTITASGAVTISGESNLARTITGGSVLAITTASTTLTAAQMCDNSVINQTASTSKVVVESLSTITLASTTALAADCLTANGDSIWLSFMNSTSSFGASSTIAAGAGLDLQMSSDTGGSVTVVPLGMAEMKLTRISTATTTVTLNDFIEGD